VSEAVRERIAGADLLLFDGTVYRDDELALAGVGEKTGRRMGHVPMTGPEARSRAWPIPPSDGASSSTSTTPTRF
jgi:pyrroloquinoline quinone biosynthesis protein B